MTAVSKGIKVENTAVLSFSIKKWPFLAVYLKHQNYLLTILGNSDFILQ
jgi:hypothetical protein